MRKKDYTIVIIPSNQANGKTKQIKLTHGIISIIKPIVILIILFILLLANLATKNVANKKEFEALKLENKELKYHIDNMETKLTNIEVSYEKVKDFYSKIRNLATINNGLNIGPIKDINYERNNFRPKFLTSNYNNLIAP